MRFCISLAVLLVLSPAFALAQALSDRVPGDALIYIGWRGTESPGAGYDQSHLKAIVDASNLPALFNDSLPKLVAKVTSDNPEAGEMASAVLKTLGPVCRHPSAFYFGGIDQNNQPPMPKLAILCDAGADSTGLLEQINNLIAKGDPQVAKMIQVKAFQNLVVVSTFVFELPAAPLSQAPGFQAAMANVPKGPFAALYVDAAGTVDLANQMVEQFGPPEAKNNWPRLRDALGLPGLKKIVWGAGFEGKNWLSESFVEAPAPRMGLLTVFDSAPLSDETLKLIPAGATLAAAGPFDLSVILKSIGDALTQLDPNQAANFNQHLDEINKALGLDLNRDLLSALGPEWAAYIDPSTTGSGALGIVLANKARDAATLEKSLGQLEEMAKPQLGPNISLSFRQSAVNGVQVHRFSLPAISPSWAIKDGVWYGSLYPQMTVAAASRNARAKSILDNPAFVELRRRLGAPEKIASITFLDLPRSAPDAYQLSLLIGQVYLGLGDMFGLDSPPMVVPPLAKIMAELEPGGSVTWADEAGYHGKALLPFPGSQMLGSGVAMAGLGYAGVMTAALTSMNRARGAAFEVDAAANLQQIGMACALYANDHKGDYPPNFAALVSTEDVTGNSFVDPRSGHHLPGNWEEMTLPERANWVDANADYVYLGAGLKQGADPKVVVAHEKMARNKQGINILFADGHVEFFSMQQARKTIDESQKLRGEAK